MPTQVRLSEAQQLYDAVDDPLLRPALEAFCAAKKLEIADELLAAVRKPTRDVMKEARLAGIIEAYETWIADLRRFAEEQLRNASQ